MTDDLVKRLRDSSRYDSQLLMREAAADRIEKLEYALHSIAEVILGAEIPDCTTIWGLATYMQETAKDALEEGKDEQGTQR